MTILAITQARTSSTRLPRKVLAEIEGKTLLQIHIERVLQASEISDFLVATTDNPADDSIIKLLKKLNVKYFRGSEEDVLDRFYKAALPYQPEWIVRLTSDCPLIDPRLIDQVIAYTIDRDLDYCSNTLIEHFPDGQDIEVFTFKALEKAWKEARLKSEREHVTPYIKKNSSFLGGKLFKSDNFPAPDNFSNVRLTVDEPEDLEVIKYLIAKLGDKAGWQEYTEVYLREISYLNRHITRNEGYKKSLKNDERYNNKL